MLRDAVSSKAMNTPRAVETPAEVPFVDSPASSKTIVANPKRRRGLAVVSFLRVGLVLPTHSCNGCRSILRSDRRLAPMTKDLYSFVKFRTKFGEDRAVTHPTTFVVHNLRLWDAHSDPFPIDGLPYKLLQNPLDFRGDRSLNSG